LRTVTSDRLERSSKQYIESTKPTSKAGRPLWNQKQSQPEPISPEPISPEINHDFLFKQLISTFFLEFLQLFTPQLAALIEPDSVRFLQQEHFIDIVDCEKRILDLLAEVKLAGDPAAILINVEAESARRRAFSQRLFFYFALLHQRP
jgi:hypothetical protein